MTLNLSPILDELTESYRERGWDASVATMTIIVFFETSAMGGLIRSQMRLLSSKHPSRVIVLDGSQSQQMHRVEGTDWIELGVNETGPEVLRSAVGTLRLPEAPVVLLWVAPGIVNDPRFAVLSEDVQTVVYNSSLLDNGHRALCELVEYVDSHPGLPLADIAYLRLAPWQESVAIFFDGKAVSELGELERIEIACGSDPEAIYLLGWLASRLQWTPASRAAFVDLAGRHICFEIRPEGGSEQITGISLHSARSTFVAEIDKSEETILLSVTGSSKHSPRYRAISNPGIAALVERAILWGQNDRIFRAALAAAGEILAQRKE